MLAIDWLGRAIGADSVHEVVPPVVTAWFHLDLMAGSLHDQHLPQPWTLNGGSISILFKGNHFAASIAAISCDHDGCA